MKTLRIRVTVAFGLDEENIVAYCRYHSIDPTKRRAAAESIRATVEQVGTMGLDEQIHEGRCWLEGDALAAADVDDGDYIAERIAARDDAPPTPADL